MKIYIAADHGGYYLKEELKGYLLSQGYNVVDKGNTSFEAKDDYTDFVIPLAEEVVKNKSDLGVVLGRSGNGEAIAANKVKGVKAALCVSEKMAIKAREHNNANILALGAEYVPVTLAKKIVTSFVKTPFSKATRHRRRVQQIEKYESAHHK